MTERSQRTRTGLVLTEETTLGLFFIQRYRFLTIDQFARAAGMKRPAASERLRELERHGVLGHFGNIGMPGYGKTPKVYFLKRKGFVLLTRESGIPPELIGTHKETHVESAGRRRALKQASAEPPQGPQSTFPALRHPNCCLCLSRLSYDL